VGGFSHWIMFFQKLSAESRNPHDGMTQIQNRSSQASGDEPTGSSPGQREARADGSTSGGGGPDTAGSLSVLVSGSTVSRCNSFRSVHK
jgi:hypothetical protein